MGRGRGSIRSMASRDPYAPTPPRGDELPCSDGEPMETQRHVVQNGLLLATLADAWAARDDFFVGSDMFVYYSETQALEAKRKGTTRFRGPDLFVVLGVPRVERRSWVAWEEGGHLPDVVIEVLSPKTAKIDRGPKMDLYARVWRTGEYFLYEPFGGVLEGYELDGVTHEYRPKTPNPEGDLEVRQMALRLGTRPGRQHELDGPWLRWIDPEGHALPSGLERADVERQRADAERQRADALAAKVAEYERRLGKT